MTLPGPLCEFLMLGGELFPDIDPVISIFAIAVAYGLMILEAYPVPTAFAGGYQVGRHPLFFAIVLYLIVSIAIVAGLVPVCEPVNGAVNGTGNFTAF